MIAPNKQNLLNLKKQEKLIKNGHKLLKEKRSGLIYTFLEMAKEGKVLEKIVSKELSKILQSYEATTAFLSLETILNNLNKVPAISLKTKKKRISGVYVDTFNLDLATPQRDKLKPDLAKSLANFGDYFDMVLKLSQLKSSTAKIAKEIKKVSRQISNLERKIEGITGDIKFIKTALLEKENFDKAVLIQLSN